ncbi:RFX DNA-binding domain-containing protein [Xylariaceae sp. FL0255]|nr:RFX DNA-binding domain-containing protein [Xylariaceae sp. FL0255]
MENSPQPPEATAVSQQKRKRNRSPGSTASIHSIATQPHPDQQLAIAHHNSFSEQQWHPNNHAAMRQHPKEIAPAGHSLASPMSAEEVILRPASQMAVHQAFPMDSGMHGTMIPYSHQQQMIHHGLTTDSFATNASFITDSDSQIMDRDDIDEADQLVPAPVGQKPSSSRTSANNELEMRQLFHSNRHRRLEEVAKELHGNERGPNSERARQVFAMLWINGVCNRGKGSVPRGRVYANYASRCATERITVLNPASFGKLVRVLFPGLKTRRLGVRGESKYHYVNFNLMDDQPELKEPVIQQPALPIQESTQFTQSFGTTQSQSVPLPTARPALPSPETNQSLQGPPTTTPIGGRAHSLYNQPDVASVEQLNNCTTKTMLQLAFPRDDDSMFDPSTSLFLPKIDPFLPSGTDPDSAKSLAALYRSHCISLVECIRYCKEKTFFHLYTSFQGTLTMPVQKLFANASLAPWIEQSDFILYQTMVRIIASLTLQVVPKTVLDTLRNISERLVAHIRESFQGQPKHVIEAKEAPATIFAGLLDRALRVNLTAHAAANMLANPANRDSMYMDWISMVRLRKIAECVPTRAMDDLVQVLLNDLRGLLNPVDVPWDMECLTLYGDVVQRNGRDEDEVASSDGSALLDGWVQFLRSLPNKFPYASPADIVWCVQRVGTEAMRDLTIAQGKSFGSWWVTKCWIDEMVAFLAEQGGFMQSQSSAQMANRLKRATSAPAGVKNTSEQESQRSAGSVTNIDTSVASNAQAQPDRAPFPSRSEGHDLLNSSNPDDSGIGIRTPEEDFPMDKYGFQEGQALDLDQAMSS